MNHKMLAEALRNLAGSIDLSCDDSPRSEVGDLKDGAESIRVLARTVEGKSLEQAFGAPGDWGYDTPIGKALADRG